MKLKMNWGTGIAALYIVFVIGMLGLVMGTMQHSVDLVTPDYYAQELVFQQQIDKVKRSSALDENAKIRLVDGVINIRFPETFSTNTLGGKINLFCPSNSQNDMIIPVKVNEFNEQVIALTSIASGKYIVKLDWEAAGQMYYAEQILHLP